MSDRKVSGETVRCLVEAGRWAPSCFNNQPWRMIVCRNQSLETVKQQLAKGNSWALRSPLIIAVASRPELDCQIKGRNYYTLGIGLTVENMLLQGISMGLVMHPIAGFKEEGVKSALNIPAEYRVHVLIICGYPGSREDADQSVLKEEDAPRQRKPVEAICSEETWSKNLDLS